jgi:hypothetical protein
LDALVAVLPFLGFRIECLLRRQPGGAHLLLQTRTRVLDGDLNQLIRRRYPAFRKTAGDDLAPIL